MRPETSRGPSDAAPRNWIAPRMPACLRAAIEAVSASTDAPFRIRPLGARGDEQLFEAREEFELGTEGRRFVVGVDREGDGARLLPGRRTA